MSVEKDRGRWSDRAAVLALAVALLGVPAAWVYCWKMAITATNGLTMTWPFKSKSMKIAEAGQVGDTFGSVNALFSGLALIGVAYAVLLQRQELDRANQAADDDKQARQASDRMHAEQSRTLLVTARLNAVQAIMQATGNLAQITAASATNGTSGSGFSAFGSVNFRDDRRELQLARQYTRVILNDIDHSGFDWKSTPELSRSVYRKYLVVSLRQAASTVDPRGRFYDVDYAIRFKFKDDIQLLLRQPGVFGGEEGEDFARILDMVEQRILKHHDELDEWEKKNPLGQVDDTRVRNDVEYRMYVAQLRNEHNEQFEAQKRNGFTKMANLLLMLAEGALRP